MSLLRFFPQQNWVRWLTLPFALCICTIVLSPLEAQESSNRDLSATALKTLTVTGQGRTSIPATLAEVSLGVEVQGKTASAAQQEVAQRSSTVIQLLKVRKVDQLQTASISLRPNYNFEGGIQRLRGYVATNIVSFQTEVKNVGEILDASVNAGASRIDSIRFRATDAEIAQAQQQALRRAIQDAQAQADVVLSTLNFTRKDIVGIQIDGAAPPRPLVRIADTFAQKAATPVEAGEQEVVASVTLQISY